MRKRKDQFSKELHYLPL